MKKILFFALLFSATFGGSTFPKSKTITQGQIDPAETGVLISTRFKSLEELKKVIQIEYGTQRKPVVRISHFGSGKKVTSILKPGVTEHDFKIAKEKGYWEKIKLGIKTPYAVLNKNDLLRVYALSRRNLFRTGDMAFYDIAENLVQNINHEDLALLSVEDLSEKGYLNTFNHLTAQTFTTSIFSEKLADFIADLHERHNMPELITGNFTPEQLVYPQREVIDNYVDIINNEWGQELGKQLKAKYKIERHTHWTPQLLTSYLNDIQNYYSWTLRIGFRPFKPTDEVVINFSNKLNTVMKDVSRIR